MHGVARKYGEHRNEDDEARHGQIKQDILRFQVSHEKADFSRKYMVNLQLSAFG
jgi:hypothetical protein